MGFLGFFGVIGGWAVMGTPGATPDGGYAEIKPPRVSGFGKAVFGVVGIRLLN